MCYYSYCFFVTKIVLCARPGSSAVVIYYSVSDCTECEAKNDGLVRYPTTLAPASGSVTVTIQCADNANIKAGSSLNVTCISNGSWSGHIPVCKCDEGHHVTTDDDGREICQG